MKTKNLIYILFYIFSLQAVGQIDNKTNLVDEQGMKIGLWIENKGNTFVYYKNGLKNGIFTNYNRKNGKIHAFGEFKDDLPTGKWYFFNEAGFLLFTEENIEKNTEFKRQRDDGVEITPKFTSYVKDYYPNGNVKEEGRVLYSEDIEIDYYKTGTWKYYNEEGVLKETKEH